MTQYVTCFISREVVTNHSCIVSDLTEDTTVIFVLFKIPKCYGPTTYLPFVCL